MKLAVIGGAGLLGSTTAFYAGAAGFFEEIKLIDLNKNILMSHVMDMSQALSYHSDTAVTNSDYTDIEDCEIILMTASLPERNVSNRNQYLHDNLSIVQKVCSQLEKLKKPHILVSASNPVDVFNYVAHKITGWDRNRFIGFCVNDTIRLRWALSEALNIPCSRLSTLCIGEHGDGQIPIFQETRVDNQPYEVAAGIQTRARESIGRWFKDYQSLNSGRTTGWTSAMGLTLILEHICKEKDAVIPCSGVLSGEYGQEGLSIGVPCRLGKDGIREIVELDLNEEQKQAFKASSDKIRGLIREIGF